MTGYDDEDLEPAPKWVYVVVAGMIVLSIIYLIFSVETNQTNLMNENLEMLLGTGNTPLKFAYLYGFTLFGAAARALFIAVTRDPGSTRTPFKFSWSFFRYDNVGRFIIVLIGAYLYVRFAKELTKIDIGPLTSVLAGLGTDWMAFIAKKAGIVDKNKNEAKFIEKKVEKQEEAKVDDSV